MRAEKENRAASLRTSRKPTQAEYTTAEHPARPCRMFRSRGQAPRYYVIIPLPLATALDLQGSEEVQWQIIDCVYFRLKRLKRLSPSPASQK